MHIVTHSLTHMPLALWQFLVQMNSLKSSSRNNEKCPGSKKPRRKHGRQSRCSTFLLFQREVPKIFRIFFSNPLFYNNIKEEQICWALSQTVISTTCHWISDWGNHWKSQQLPVGLITALRKRESAATLSQLIVNTWLASLSPTLYSNTFCCFGACAGTGKRKSWEWAKTNER